jgi:hypothetical protein
VSLIDVPHCAGHKFYNPACQACADAYLRGRVLLDGAPSSAPEAALSAGILRAEDETPPPGETVSEPASGVVVEVAEADIPGAAMTDERGERVEAFVREVLATTNRFLAAGDSPATTRDACVSLLGLAAHVFATGTENHTGGLACEAFEDLAHDTYHDYEDKVEQRKAATKGKGRS